MLSLDIPETCMLHAHEIHACCMLATYKIHVASIAVVYLGFLWTYVVPIKLLDWLTFLLSCCSHTGQRQFFILMIILYLPLVIIVSGLFLSCAMCWNPSALLTCMWTRYNYCCCTHHDMLLSSHCRNLIVESFWNWVPITKLRKYCWKAFGIEFQSPNFIVKWSACMQS